MSVHHRKSTVAAAIGLAVAGAVAIAPAASAAPEAADDHGRGGPHAESLRVATFNASLNRFNEGDLVADLLAGSVQAAVIAEIIQRTDPDILLLNEFDYVTDDEAIDLFRDLYLEVGQDGAAPVEYPYAFVAPSNTGIPSGYDLNNDDDDGGPDDAFGFGFFPGQYGMAVLSKYPIATDDIRTFQHFLWKDMPGALLPDDPTTDAPADWFTPEELDVVRLSSKSHWDVPVLVGNVTVHVLASHPTPPTFDGAEDRNGRRNHDEIRFWSDYVTPGAGAYVYDDEGATGGLNPSEPFVILGDQNADPFDGDSTDDAIDQLLDNRRIVDPMPTSEGAVEAALLQGGANDAHVGDPATDTADFNDNPAPGNLRADYVLPSRKLVVDDAGVFWPVSADPLSALTGSFPFPSSDHRLVWVDLTVRG